MNVTMGKLLQIYKEFSESMKEGEEPVRFWEVASKVVEECIGSVETMFSVSLAGIDARTQLCTAIEFDTLLHQFRWMGAKPTAFRDPFGRFIAIDVGTILSESNSLESFVTNFVLNVMEELVHEAFSNENEIEVKIKAHQVTENYLQWEIPREYKEASLRRAANPNY